jgi:5-methylcytosine-specific restriction endonuclease McrA
MSAVSRRGTTTEQGYGHSWRLARQRAILRDRMHRRPCELCHLPIYPGQPVAVDHIRPVRERPDLRLMLENLRTVHASCNLRRHRLLEAERGVRNGWQRPMGSEPRKVWPGAIDIG